MRSYLWILLIFSAYVLSDALEVTCPDKDLTRFCDCFGDDIKDPTKRWNVMSRPCKMAFYSKCRKINDKYDYLQYPWPLEVFLGVGNKGCPYEIPCSVVDLAYSAPTTRGSRLYSVAENNQCQAVLNYLPQKHEFVAQQKELGVLAATFLRAYLSVNLGVLLQCFPLPPLPPQPEMDAKCEGKANGNYGLGDCRRFYTCSDGVAYPLECPAGLYFDEAQNACDYQQYAGCNSGVSGGDSGDSDGASPSVEDGDDNNSNDNGGGSPMADYCRYKADGNYPFGDCTKFVTCTNGRTIALDCPAGTFYDAKYDACNGEKVDGCDSSDNAGESPPLDDQENPSEMEEDPLYCVGKENGNYAYADCSHFVTCSNGMAYYFACPHNLYFDNTTNRCETWQNHQGTCPSTSN